MHVPFAGSFLEWDFFKIQYVGVERPRIKNSFGYSRFLNFI